MNDAINKIEYTLKGMFMQVLRLDEQIIDWQLV